MSGLVPTSAYDPFVYQGKVLNHLMGSDCHRAGWHQGSTQKVVQNAVYRQLYQHLQFAPSCSGALKTGRASKLGSDPLLLSSYSRIRLQRRSPLDWPHPFPYITRTQLRPEKCPCFGHHCQGYCLKKLSWHTAVN